MYIYGWRFPNMGTPKSSILIGFSIINHPFWWYPHLRNPHIYIHIHTYIHTYIHFSTRRIHNFTLVVFPETCVHPSQGWIGYCPRGAGARSRLGWCPWLNRTMICKWWAFHIYMYTYVYTYIHIYILYYIYIYILYYIYYILYIILYILCYILYILYYILYILYIYYIIHYILYILNIIYIHINILYIIYIHIYISISILYLRLCLYLYM